MSYSMIFLSQQVHFKIKITNSLSGGAGKNIISFKYINLFNKLFECGVWENSWGKVFRDYLKMTFGDNCLGESG